MPTRNYGNAKKKARQIRRDSSTFYKITQLYIKDYTKKFSFAYKFFMGLKFFMEIYMPVIWIVVYVVNHRVGQEAAENLSSILVFVQAVLALFILFNFGWNDPRTKYERSCGL
jgi:cyanate permease